MTTASTPASALGLLPFDLFYLGGVGTDSSDLLVLLVIGIVIAGIVGSMGSSSSPTSDLPTEIADPHTVAYYEDQAARARALKQQLDADTELAESILRNARTHGELEELGELLDHEQTKRLLRNEEQSR